MRKLLNIGTMLTLAASVFFISGCKKSSSPNGLIATYTQVISDNGVNTTTVYTFSYDGQNRLTEYQATGKVPITFAYSSGQVTQTQGTSITIYSLNSQGLATSDNQGNTYVYDNNGYLTAQTNTAQGTSATYTISNGDVLSEVSTSAGVTTNYAYTFLSTADYRSNGTSFLGKSNVNLVNSETISNPGTSTYTFSYTFDSKGRVQTQQVVSNGETITDTYTYTD